MYDCRSFSETNRVVKVSTSEGGGNSYKLTQQTNGRKVEYPRIGVQEVSDAVVRCSFVLFASNVSPFPIVALKQSSHAADIAWIETSNKFAAADGVFANRSRMICDISNPG